MSASAPPEHVSRTPYELAPLEDDDQIRLIVIHPGEKNSEIHCTLRSVQLEDVQWKPGSEQDHVRHLYEALSYVWGNPNVTLPIFCNGVAIQVTANLHAALDRLRLQDRVRVLWADAICINQKDIAERNRQVRRLQSIYSGASQVVVWLGKTEVAEPFANLGQLLEQITSEPDLSLYNLPEGTDWSSFAGLFGDDWFSRKWTIQEWVFARSIKFVKGEKEYNLWLKRPDETSTQPMNQDLGDGIIISQIATAGTVLAENAPADVSVLMDNAGTGLLLWFQRYFGYPGWSLSTVLSRTSNYNATLMVDHIIAVLNLASDCTRDERRYLIDYNVAADALIMRTAKMLVQKYGVTSMQAAIGPGISWKSKAVAREGLVPSWVPRYLFKCEREDQIDMTLENVGHGGALKSIDNKLQVQGLQAGELVKMTADGTPTNNLSFPLCRKRLSEWSVFLNDLRSDRFDSHRLFWDLLLTFVTSHEAWGGAALSMEYHEQLVDSIFEKALQLDNHEVEKLSKMSLEQLIWRLVADSANYLLCQTTNGALGLVGLRARPGDTVFVCSVDDPRALIVRSGDEDFSVICDAILVNGRGESLHQRGSREIIIS